MREEEGSGGRRVRARVSWPDSPGDLDEGGNRSTSGSPPQIAVAPSVCGSRVPDPDGAHDVRPQLCVRGGDLPGKAGENLNNLTSSNTLYSGRLPLIAAPHAMTGLVQGIMATGRRVRGRCEVRGQRANMWALVAQAMGFSVMRMR